MASAESLKKPPELISSVTLSELTVSVYPELIDAGDSVRLSGCFDYPQLQKGAMLIQIPDGIEYSVELSNVGAGILLSGNVSARIVTDCTRCAEETELNLAAEVEGFYVTDARDAENIEYDDEVIVIGSNKKIHLFEPILAALVFEIPFTVLCKEDCAGLCDKCYANLNFEECICEDEVDPDHPFAALRTLLSEDNGENTTL